jgi:hypothetical protein
MRRESTRPLVVLLLLTLAAPAPRMAAWLLGASPTRAFASTRNEPPARGRNRIASPVGTGRVAAMARLASGAAAKADLATRSMPTPRGAAGLGCDSSFSPSLAPAPGTIPLRC